jgi:hypothetical protein
VHAEHLVGLYTRVLVKVSDPGASLRGIAELRALDEKLGLSPKALQGLHWEIAAAEDERPPLRTVQSGARAYVPS